MGKARGDGDGTANLRYRRCVGWPPARWRTVFCRYPYRPPRVGQGRLAFTFVTDGVTSAVEQAKQVAGDKNVSVGSASIVQQCLKAGLLDEIHIDLLPVLLGGGVRLFDHLGSEPIELESIQVVEGKDVTHLALTASSNNRRRRQFTL